MVEEVQTKKRRLGLVPRIIIAIIIGTILGQLSWIPIELLRGLMTFTSLFSNFLGFIIPLMIIGFVVSGIADLTQGAGKLLAITVIVAYTSTIIAGSFSYGTAITLFPHFITEDLIANVSQAGPGLESYFDIELEPMLDVTSAIVFAFTMGLGISYLKSIGRGKVLDELFFDFGVIITLVLNRVIIPLLPFYIAGNFANMSYNGTVFTILSVFWKVFIILIILHIVYICLMFVVFGLYAGKNPWVLIKNQIPGYLTAVGTQSSAATIPVNLECGRKNGVSEDILNFVVPLCATIHLAGSIITIMGCSIAILLIHDLPIVFPTMMGFMMMLGIAMVAAPGAPGGAIMSALPFLPMAGIVSDTMQQLMISLYITQDSFGTAANVSGDNAIAIFVDEIYRKYIKRQK